MQVAKHPITRRTATQGIISYSDTEMVSKLSLHVDLFLYLIFSSAEQATWKEQEGKEEEPSADPEGMQPLPPLEALGP